MASSAVHYRVELGAKSMKLATLVDLVRSLPGVPLAVCVGARDALDDAASAIVHATASDPSPPSVTCLHSDQTPGERARALAAFRARTRPRGDDRARDQDPRAADAASLERSRTSALVVVSDACLPVEAPLDLPLLVNLDPPRSRDLRARRAKATLESGGGDGAARGGRTPRRVVVDVVAADDRDWDFRGGDGDSGDGGGGGAAHLDPRPPPVDLLAIVREAWLGPEGERG
jgi:uncharacterized membrane protein YgcG